MNIILIRPEEISGGTAVLSDTRHTHIKNVLKASEGDSLKAGILGGGLGTAEILNITDTCITLRPDCNAQAPTPLPVTVILALPRPKVFRRVLFGLACAGIKDIHIINSWRVDKSYWESPYLERDKIDEHLFDALQQSKDTILPKVTLHRFFMEFAGEVLEKTEIPNRFIAHPAGSFRKEFPKPMCLAVGCEGGFIQKELDTFERYGFQQFSAGERILTTEYAVPYILGMIT